MNKIGSDLWRSWTKHRSLGSIAAAGVAVWMVVAALASPGRAGDPLPPQNDPQRQWLEGGRVAAPEVVAGRFELPPLLPPSIATDTVGNGRSPEGFRAQRERPLQMLPEDALQRGLSGNWSVANWAAPNTFSNPRYFEDRMLERHGHERFGMFQPVASGVRFVATVPMLPYLMTLRDPCDCEYTLGYYRPGSCAPVMFQRPPWDRQAIIAESVAVATGMIVLP